MVRTAIPTLGDLYGWNFRKFRFRVKKPTAIPTLGDLFGWLFRRFRFTGRYKFNSFTLTRVNSRTARLETIRSSDNRSIYVFVNGKTTYGPVLGPSGVASFEISLPVLRTAQIHVLECANGVSIRKQGNTVNITPKASWDASQDAVRYRIYKRHYNVGSFSKFMDIDPFPIKSHYDLSLPEVDGVGGVTYEFRCTALSKSGNESERALEEPIFYAYNLPLESSLSVTTSGAERVANSTFNNQAVNLFVRNRDTGDVTSCGPLISGVDKPLPYLTTGNWDVYIEQNYNYVDSESVLHNYWPNARSTKNIFIHIGEDEPTIGLPIIESLTTRRGYNTILLESVFSRLNGVYTATVDLRETSGVPGPTLITRKIGSEQENTTFYLKSSWADGKTYIGLTISSGNDSITRECAIIGHDTVLPPTNFEISAEN